ncbi:MAG: DUF177 domain-containing protein [Armatimonadetes bacterium]|nr:DUF177 domain-containing protein [Armatimonadota bacterium]MDW8122999.1 DUF177 domain-containing protein [Armatimonadota bacterium]
MKEEEGYDRPTREARMDLRRLINHPGDSIVYEFVTELQLWEDEGPWVTVVGEAVGRNMDGRMVLITGRVSGQIGLNCSRCLTPFYQNSETTFEAHCEIRTFRRIAEGLPVEEGEELTAIFDGETANIGELSRQALLLTLPLAPVCRQDCRGLCPYCGANRNEGLCNCQEPSDPRWSPLDLFFTVHKGNKT